MAAAALPSTLPSFAKAASTVRKAALALVATARDAASAALSVGKAAEMVVTLDIRFFRLLP